MPTDIQQLIRKNILSLTPYSSAREEYTGKEGIFLDANENPYGIYNRYPDPLQIALKQRLSVMKKIDPACIFIGNGSDEIIDLAFRIFCEPGRDKAITFSPTYGMYEVAARINDIELIQLPLNRDFQIDRISLQPFLSDKKIKLLIICSPNNPTGNLFHTEDIEYVLRSFKGMVLIDEAYIDFSDRESLLTKTEDYPNLIISQTLSKAWGLAGIRLGIAYMNKETIIYYNKIKAPYNISVISQETALEALNHPDVYREKVKEILSEKIKLAGGLKRLDIVKKIYPSDTNFLLVDVGSADDVYKQLIDRKIIIRNRHSVIPGCIRITIGTPEENRQLLTALKEISHG